MRSTPKPAAPSRSFDGMRTTHRAPVVRSVMAGVPVAKKSMPAAVKRRTMDGVRNGGRVWISKAFWRRVIRFSFRRVQIFFRRFSTLLSVFIEHLSPRKALYMSLVSGIAFGMVTIVSVEHLFGGGASAAGTPTVLGEQATVPEEKTGVSDAPKDIAVADPAADTGATSPDDLIFGYFSDEEQAAYEDNIRQMVKGYPIEPMLPYIFEHDRLTAAFLIGIAKKESNWGKRVPVLDGQDCFNYWGYRGIRKMMGTGGHTCFNSRKDAVDSVSKRLETLINSEKLNTPEKMIVWKCGYSCAGQNHADVLKWIADVDIYFSQLDE